MLSRRALFILLGLAFVGLALKRSGEFHPSDPVSDARTARQERVRAFWETYRRAGQARAAGDPAAAIALYQKAIALRPDHEDALYYLGNSYLELSRYPEAKATYQQLIATNPLGSSRGYVQLALLHSDRRAGDLFDLTKANRFFRQALEIDPDSGALLGIGEVALMRGAWSKAREALQGANADNPMSVAAPYLLGYLSWRQRRFGEAWRWFGLAVKRCSVKKPPVPWSEEGDFKADPELRWRALARQSVFGDDWLRLRR